MGNIKKEKVAEMVMNAQTSLEQTQRNIFTMNDIRSMLQTLVEQIDLSENEIEEVVINNNDIFTEANCEKFSELFISFIKNESFNFTSDCASISTDESYSGDSVTISAEINESEIESQVINQLDGDSFADFLKENWNGE
jgi:hypothetical protein